LIWFKLFHITLASGSETISPSEFLEFGEEFLNIRTIYHLMPHEILAIPSEDEGESYEKEMSSLLQLSKIVSVANYSLLT